MGKILLTGGVGYIGSHTAVALTKKGYDVVIVDDLRNSSFATFSSTTVLAGKNIEFHCVDVGDYDEMKKVFTNTKIDAVIHFAADKYVAESMREPLKYYENNVSGTINLLKVMDETGVRKLVFSSSAAVYGDNNTAPYTENMPIGNCASPYSETKSVVENMLRWLCNADDDWSVVSLRYFNPIGANSSGMLGDDSTGEEHNFMWYLMNSVAGNQECLHIYGSDYDTRDGTTIRDFIHVEDVATGHISALEYLDTLKGYEAFNLGTGTGVSLLELIKAFSETTETTVHVEFDEPREGDIVTSIADISKAQEILKWNPEYSVERMCKDSWRYFRTVN